MRRYGGGILYATLPFHMQRGCFRIQTHDQQVTKAQLYRCIKLKIVFTKSKNLYIASSRYLHKKAHYSRSDFTTAMVRSDTKALGHYGSTMIFWVDHEPHQLTTTVVSLWRLLLDPWRYHLNMVMLITMVVVNVPQPWSSAESLNLQKFV